jgi:hypothetical protein
MTHQCIGLELQKKVHDEHALTQRKKKRRIKGKKNAIRFFGF